MLSRRSRKLRAGSTMPSSRFVPHSTMLRVLFNTSQMQRMYIRIALTCAMLEEETLWVVQHQVQHLVNQHQRLQHPKQPSEVQILHLVNRQTHLALASHRLYARNHHPSDNRRRRQDHPRHLANQPSSVGLLQASVSRHQLLVSPLHQLLPLAKPATPPQHSVKPQHQSRPLDSLHLGNPLPPLHPPGLDNSQQPRLLARPLHSVRNHQRQRLVLQRLWDHLSFPRSVNSRLRSKVHSGSRPPMRLSQVPLANLPRHLQTHSARHHNRRLFLALIRPSPLLPIRLVSQRRLSRRQLSDSLIHPAIHLVKSQPLHLKPSHRVLPSLLAVLAPLPLQRTSLPLSLSMLLV